MDGGGDVGREGRKEETQEASGSSRGQALCWKQCLRCSTCSVVQTGGDLPLERVWNNPSSTSPSLTSKTGRRLLVYLCHSPRDPALSSVLLSLNAGY